MRGLVAFGLLLLAGCRELPPDEAALCRRAPECANTYAGVCDLACVQRAARPVCCACLAERGCVDRPAESCVEALEGFESVWIADACLEEGAPCAGACADAFSPGESARTDP